MFLDVEEKIKRKNAILFSRDSKCLQELIRLIEKQNRRTLVMWALDCAKVPPAQLEERYPKELRPRKALELCEAWSEGKVKMPIAKKAILATHGVAKEIDDKVAGALCHGIGQACATVHVETHALGLPLYELTAMVLALGKGNYHEKVQEKINDYSRQLTYWQEKTPTLDRPWASFLLADNKPNKEKLLNSKKR